MGLDMYLKGKRYISSAFNGGGDDELAQTIGNALPELNVFVPRWGKSIVKEVVVEVGYWRKANAIHNWFVKNCQEGEDDCGTYYVGREQLEELRGICQTILADRSLASELLPPTAGFFFGSTSVDDFYFQDLKQTVDLIDQALTLPNSWEFEYESSW